MIGLFASTQTHLLLRTRDKVAYQAPRLEQYLPFYTRTRKNSIINIYVDNQAAIKAISSYCIKSKNVHRSRDAIEKLAANSRLHIYWVPGHKGIMGNEIVHEMAKSAVRLPFEQEKDILKPLNTVYNEMDNYMKKLVEARWTNLTTCKTTKVMCNTYLRSSERTAEPL